MCIFYIYVYSKWLVIYNNRDNLHLIIIYHQIISILYIHYLINILITFLFYSDKICHLIYT